MIAQLLRALRATRQTRGQVRAIVVLSLGTVAFAPAARAQGSAPGSDAVPVQAAVAARPDTVHVGDPFVVEVGIRAPVGATITFPDAPDSSATVQALDPVRVEARPDSAGVVQWAYYRVAAWDIGTQPIVLADAVVRVGSAERRVSLAGHTVFVQSVLPADTTLRVPKPARSLYEFGAYPWWIWLLAAAVALLLLLVWWWMRRRRRARPAVVVDPYERAEKEFARIEALKLVDAGERGRYVALVVEVMRDYLAARYEAARLSFTTTELLTAIRGERAVPQERLARVLNEADLIKFAQRPVTPERARELGREARGVVVAEHAASRPVPEEKAA